MKKLFAVLVLATCLVSCSDAMLEPDLTANIITMQSRGNGSGEARRALKNEFVKINGE